MDGKKPGLIDCTKRNWENSCSLCFLQVMRLIRGARIITNFRGSFPAVGDRPCHQIFFGNYNRGLYCLPMPIHSAFSFSGPDFRQFDRDLRCTPAGDEDVRPGGGNKECPISSRYARDTSLDMPRISLARRSNSTNLGLRSQISSCVAIVN